MAKYPNSKQFRRELETGLLHRLYLLLGEEEGDKDKAVDAIVKKIFTSDEARKNSLGRFHMGSDTVMNAAEFALSQSMFFPEKVCIINNVEKIKESADKALFHECIDSLPDHTTLIMTTPENRPPAVFTSEQVKGFKIVQFWRFFDQDIYKYIVINLKKTGLTIDDRAIELLIELTGKDIKKIDDAMEMIHYSGEAGLVDSAMIRNYIHDVKTISMYDFIDALFMKDKYSMKLLRRIQEEGVPELLLLNLICKQAETVENIQKLVESGLSMDEAVKKSGVYAKHREKYWHFVKILPPEKIQKIFPLISAADMRLKSESKGNSFISSPMARLVSDMLTL